MVTPINNLDGELMRFKILELRSFNERLKILEEQDIRHYFATRMRSLEETPKEIEQLYLFLEISLDNINEIGKHSSNL